MRKTVRFELVQKRNFPVLFKSANDHASAEGKQIAFFFWLHDCVFQKNANFSQTLFQHERYPETKVHVNANEMIFLNNAVKLHNVHNSI